MSALSRLADVLVRASGELSVTWDGGREVAPGSILAANHTALADPAVVVAALRRLGAEPVVLAAAGLWRVPVLGPALRREGHIPVYRGGSRAAEALGLAAAALEQGRTVLLYPEGGLPRRRDAGERAPEGFRSGLARLSALTGAPVVPVGQAGARRLTSGGAGKQLAGALTAPLRRPRLHVHIGRPVDLFPGGPFPAGGAAPGARDLGAATARARDAVTAAWRVAVGRCGGGVSAPAPAAGGAAPAERAGQVQ
ncbi:lysophospholipid acyltransferase family protein [Streptomyces sp. NPDC005805]|uniref:lysophospholipid acyltransferase family protein n=1 Tax=Streptomyces sp. NPDC005805 TaxID=3157068 RepID=UPI0033D7F077